MLTATEKIRRMAQAYDAGYITLGELVNVVKKILEEENLPVPDGNDTAVLADALCLLTK